MHIEDELLQRLLNKAKLVDIVAQMAILSTSDPKEFASLLERIERRLAYYAENKVL